MADSGTLASPAAVAKPHVPPGLIVALACVAQFMVVLDTSIVNVALPSMRHSLGLSANAQQWVVDGYLVTFGGFLLLAAGPATCSGAGGYSRPGSWSSALPAWPAGWPAMARHCWSRASFRASAPPPRRRPA